MFQKTHILKLKILVCCVFICFKECIWFVINLRVYAYINTDLYFDSLHSKLLATITKSKVCYFELCFSICFTNRLLKLLSQGSKKNLYKRQEQDKRHDNIHKFKTNTKPFHSISCSPTHSSASSRSCSSSHSLFRSSSHSSSRSLYQPPLHNTHTNKMNSDDST